MACNFARRMEFARNARANCAPRWRRKRCNGGAANAAPPRQRHAAPPHAAAARLLAATAAHNARSCRVIGLCNSILSHRKCFSVSTCITLFATIIPRPRACVRLRPWRWRRVAVAARAQAASKYFVQGDVFQSGVYAGRVLAALTQSAEGTVRALNARAYF